MNKILSIQNGVAKVEWRKNSEHAYAEVESEVSGRELVFNGGDPRYDALHEKFCGLESTKKVKGKMNTEQKKNWDRTHSEMRLVAVGSEVQGSVRVVYDEADGRELVRKSEAEKYQAIVDAAISALDSAVGAFAAREIGRDEFEAAVNAVAAGFGAMTDDEITAEMGVEFSGAYSDSESIYVLYDISANAEPGDGGAGDSIVSSNGRIRLSRHAARN